MAVVSTELVAPVTATDSTGDIDLTLTAGLVRSDPVDGASLVVALIIHQDSTGVTFLGVTDDAAFDAFYGTDIWSDGLNHYDGEIFSSPGARVESQTGLILNGLDIGDTITFHYDAPIGEYRAYVRGYTGVNIDRCWTAPDEISMDALFYGGGAPTPFQLLVGDSGDSYSIVAEQNGHATDLTVWTQPLSTVNPTTPGGDLLLVVGRANVSSVFPSGPVVFDDAGLIEMWGFNDVFFGAEAFGWTQSWVEKPVVASDVIDLQETMSNPFHQDMLFSGNVLRPGPGPRANCNEPQGWKQIRVH
jgi:hypothetical protein